MNPEEAYFHPGQYLIYYQTALTKLIPNAKRVDSNIQVVLLCEGRVYNRWGYNSKIVPDLGLLSRDNSNCLLSLTIIFHSQFIAKHLKHLIGNN